MRACRAAIVVVCVIVSSAAGGAHHAVAALGVSLLSAMVDGRVHHVRLPEGVSLESITARYLAHPEVAGVEPNSIIRLR